MHIRKEMRAVIYCCEIGFSKVIDFWPMIPDVGHQATIELCPGQLWDMQCFNHVYPDDHDKVETFFFESSDPTLFDCLCNNLNLEGGWVEVEKTEAVTSLPATT